MRVLLVNPPIFAGKSHIRTYATFPNGILYMAAMLEKHGHEVQVFDNVVDSRLPSDFISYNPAIIGFSVVTGPDIDAAIAQSIEFKKIVPGAKIVWGGAHPSILPEQTLSEPYVDYVVIGAGEYTLLELTEHVGNGHRDISGIKGLAHKKDGRITINESRPFIKNLDELPDPAWHLVDIKKYWDVTLNTSRGCPFQCTFCYNHAFHGGYRAELSAERIVAQIEHLRQRYGVNYIKIWEDNFTFYTARLHQFCNMLIDKGLKIKWDTEARANLKEEDIALMAKAGCVSVGLGMETGSQRMLEFVKKATTVEKMERTFWLLVKHKIMPRLYLIYGLPTESEEDFELTRRLLERLDYPPYTYGKFIPYPGTTLAKFCQAKGMITPPQKLGDWAGFTTLMATSVNLSSVPQERLNEASATFRKQYAIRPLRFAFRHNRSYLLSLILSPSRFLQTIRNLIKYYVMVLFSSPYSETTRSLKLPSKKVHVAP